MNDRLELWVLRAASTGMEPRQLRGLLRLSAAAEDLGDQAQQMVWLVEQSEDLHPILAIALGETDDVVVQLPVAAGSEADGATLASLQLNLEPGFQVLAIRRGGSYVHRPRGQVTLLADDEILALGPYEGRELLAERLGWQLEVDEDTGEFELLPLPPDAVPVGGRSPGDWMRP
jgi:uncharacterized protein with PhoU and TrkA domain